MIEATLLEQAGLSGGFIAVVLILYRAIKWANGHRIVSDCCGRKLTIGIRVDDMAATPQPIPEAVVVVQNPLPRPQPVVATA